MFDIGFWELLVIAVVSLLVAGPERLPGLVRDAGRWAAKLRRYVMQAKYEFEQQLRIDEVKDFSKEVERMDELMDIAPDKTRQDQDNRRLNPMADDSPRPDTDTETAAHRPPCRTAQPAAALPGLCVCHLPRPQRIRQRHLRADSRAPLLAQLPDESSMIATEVASPFLVPFKLTFFAAVFVSVPYLLYQAWAFVAPGLYQNERRLVLPLLSSSVLLFYLGCAFAFFVVFPLLFAFLTSTAPVGVTVMTDIGHYLNFILKMFFAFGIAFEVPIAIILFVYTGLASVESLARKRAYIVVGAFTVGMLLTPPDIISQVLLAVPVWLLFEVGLILGRFVKRRAEDTPEDSASATE